MFNVLHSLASYYFKLLLYHSRFGEDSVEKMVDWALENVPPSTIASAASPCILEIGSGNGTLLFALQESGYPAQMLYGIDYSEDAVRLARAIGNSRAAALDAEDEDEDRRIGEETQEEEDAERQIGGAARKEDVSAADHINFDVCDFLSEDAPHHSEWGLVLDKGTFDAIALAEKDENGKNGADYYPGRLARIVKPGGYFLITCICLPCICIDVFSSAQHVLHDAACNFTEDELRARFANEETGLRYQYAFSSFLGVFLQSYL